jgi:hypothetical protein
MFFKAYLHFIPKKSTKRFKVFVVVISFLHIFFEPNVAHIYVCCSPHPHVRFITCKVKYSEWGGKCIHTGKHKSCVTDTVINYNYVNNSILLCNFPYFSKVILCNNSIMFLYEVNKIKQQHHQIGTWLLSFISSSKEPKNEIHLSGSSPTVKNENHVQHEFYLL